MQVRTSISAMVLASAVAAATSTAANATTFDIDFTISSDYFSTNGQVSNVSAADFPAKGSATIASVGSGYRISGFSLLAGKYSFPTDFYSEVTAVSQNGKTISGFVLSSYAVDYQRTLTFDFAKGHLGNFALVQADPDYASLGCVNCVSATLASSTSPGTVPLPSSAPLFGAALVALAAVGYRSRSRKTSASA